MYHVAQQRFKVQQGKLFIFTKNVQMNSMFITAEVLGWSCYFQCHYSVCSIYSDYKPVDMIDISVSLLPTLIRSGSDEDPREL